MKNFIIFLARSYSYPSQSLDFLTFLYQCHVYSNPRFVHITIQSNFLLNMLYNICRLRKGKKAEWLFFVLYVTRWYAESQWVIKWLVQWVISLIRIIDWFSKSVFIIGSFSLFYTSSCPLLYSFSHNI